MKTCQPWPSKLFSDRDTVFLASGFRQADSWVNFYKENSLIRCRLYFEFFFAVALPWFTLHALWTYVEVPLHSYQSFWLWAFVSTCQSGALNKCVLHVKWKGFPVLTITAEVNIRQILGSPEKHLWLRWESICSGLCEFWTHRIQVETGEMLDRKP